MANQPGMVAVCLDCGSQQSDRYVERNVFYQQGGSVPCQYCGGVCTITRSDQVKATLKHDRDKRGIGG